MELKKRIIEIKDRLVALHGAAELSAQEQVKMEDEVKAYDIYSYVNMAIDYEYILDDLFRFKGARLTLSEKPLIFIDTCYKMIIGIDGNETEKEMLPKDICEEINDIYKYYYNVERGWE